MTLFPWERAPFFSNPGLLKKGLETQLPFSLGAISRLGSKHRKHGMNNQDAIHLDIQPHTMIGVLCDGTSSTHSELERIFSNNEIGSNLLSFLLSRICHELISKWRGPYSKAFVRYLDTQFKKEYKQLLRLLSQGRDESIIASHFATTTCIGYIILEKEYLVFGAGDGFIIHNGESIPLKRLPFVTLSNVKEKAPVLSLLAKGKTKNLTHLALLSDGFASHGVTQHPAFKSFLERSEHESGFHDISSQFHLEVLNEILKKRTDQWPHDDASCIIVRRLINKNT